jgi:hypothetical protein
MKRFRGFCQRDDLKRSGDNRTNRSAGNHAGGCVMD